MGEMVHVEDALAERSGDVEHHDTLLPVDDPSVVDHDEEMVGAADRLENKIKDLAYTGEVIYPAVCG